MPKPKGSKELEFKKRKLVEEYILNGGDKKKAADAIGLKHASKHAYKLFRDPYVKELLEERRQQLREKFEVKFETIMDELADIALGYKRLAKYKKVDDKGQPYWDFTGATEDDLAFITTMDSEISFIENEDGEDASPIQVRKVKIGVADLKDAKGALDSLAKLIGLDKQRLEISGPNGEPVKVDLVETARKLAFVLNKGSLELDKQETE